MLKTKRMSKFSNSGNLVLTLKVGLISTGVLSVGILLRNSAPLISDFVSSDVPTFWNVILQWLKPPYLYLVINCIIISIFASSKLQQHKEDNRSTVSADVLVDTQEKVVVSDDRGQSGYVLGYGDINPTAEKEEEEKMISDETPVTMDGGDKVAPETAAERSGSKDLLAYCEKGKGKEKPPISARFGHKKTVKANPEGEKVTLKVSKQKRQDTLDTTWKKITEGPAMPLTRHLKKSDTWDTHLRSQKSPPPAPKMKKTEIFSDRATTVTDSGDAGDNLGRSPNREPSPGRDELNRRVEAFIKKFNEEMRLQRQRYLEQYNEMIPRRAVQKKNHDFVLDPLRANHHRRR